MRQFIPDDAKCVVCGKPHTTDFVETTNGNFVYFHKDCFKQELPKETKEKIWRQL